MTLAHNVGSDAEVGEVLARAEQAGGTVLKAAQRGEVGFVHGFFADPAGFRWEVAHNPGWVINADGTVSIGPAEPAAVEKAAIDNAAVEKAAADNAG
jgi:hypothetical protein